MLYDFRVSTLGIQVVLWTVLGLAFGALVDRYARRTGSAHRTGTGAT